MEREPTPSRPSEPAAERPSYDRIAAGLTRLLAATGVPVREEFLPNKLLSSHDYATRSLVVHPWIAPRARADVLLGNAVEQIIATKKRGKDAPRQWLVEATLARRYGLPVDPAVEHEHGELTKQEQALVKRIADAVEANDRETA